MASPMIKLKLVLNKVGNKEMQYPMSRVQGLAQLNPQSAMVGKPQIDMIVGEWKGVS